MKKLFIVATLLLGIQICHAQNWDEWWRQRKTQIKYLLKQIAALKVYTDYLEKGYQIAQDGTRLIKDIKNSDFNLHNEYFTSLTSVNPAICKSSRLKDIISIQNIIIYNFKNLIGYCQQYHQFSSLELNHFNEVYKNLVSECERSIDELVSVTSDGEFEMKDDGRINRIEMIYQGMLDKLSFARTFCNETVSVAVTRSMFKREIDVSKKLIQ